MRSPCDRSSATRGGHAWWWTLGLALALIAGASLRVVWPADIEYKADEAWTFEQTQLAAAGEPVPWLGMPTSINLRNPGLSLWAFLPLRALSGARDPTELARAVQLLNIGALGLLICFALIAVPRREREPWLWGAALVAVNPLAVLMQRKIWPPSILPIFTLVTLWSWWLRRTPWGACAFGVVGMLGGQVHGSAFFVAAGLALWSLLFERRQVPWRYGLAGAALGSVTMLPWLLHAWTDFPSRSPKTFVWTRWLEFRYWLRWMTEPLGLGLDYTLTQQFGDFLRYPLVSGYPTFIALALHCAMITLGVAILLRAGQRVWRTRRPWRELIIAPHSATGFALSAAFWGTGILLTAPALAIHRHYMQALFALPFVWLAWIALRPHDTAGSRTGRRLLLALAAVQLATSTLFLSYIHIHQGVPHGEYGLTYGAQMRARDSGSAPGAATPPPALD